MKGSQQQGIKRDWARRPLERKRRARNEFEPVEPEQTSHCLLPRNPGGVRAPWDSKTLAQEQCIKNTTPIEIGYDRVHP